MRDTCVCVCATCGPSLSLTPSFSHSLSPRQSPRRVCATRKYRLSLKLPGRLAIDSYDEHCHTLIVVNVILSCVDKKKFSHQRRGI